MIAIGLKSGRIAIHDTKTLELVKLIDPLFLFELVNKKKKKKPSDKALIRSRSVVNLSAVPKGKLNIKLVAAEKKLPIFKAGYRLDDSTKANDESTNFSSIKSMLFLYGSDIIITTRENKSVSVYDLRGSAVAVQEYLQVPAGEVSTKDKSSKPNSSDEESSLYLVGAFSQGVDPAKTSIHPDGVWGLLRVYAGEKRPELNVYHTSLGANAKRNGPREVIHF